MIVITINKCTNKCWEQNCTVGNKSMVLIKSFTHLIKHQVLYAGKEINIRALFEEICYQYCIVQNSGGEILWWTSDFKVLVKKTLANARHLYYWQEKNLANLLRANYLLLTCKNGVFNDALTHDQSFERSHDQQQCTHFW